MLSQTHEYALRVMVHDDKTLALMISPGKQGSIHLQKYRARGEPAPVAITFGEDPLLMLVALGVAFRDKPHEQIVVDIVGASSESQRRTTMFSPMRPTIS